MAKNRYYIGADTGASAGKFSIENLDTGEIKRVQYSSMFAYAPEEATDMPKYNGKRYFYGNAAKAHPDTIIDITSYEQNEELGPLSIWSMLKSEGIEVDEVEGIGIGLSFAHIQHGPKFLKKMTKFKVNGEIYDFTNKIVLLPQGAGAKYSIEDQHQILPDAYLIVDGGFLTIDNVDVIDSTLRPENVKGIEGKGMIIVARNIQEFIRTKFNQDIPLKIAKEVLLSKRYVNFALDIDIDLTDEINAFAKSYTEFLIKELKQLHSREFSNYEKIFIVGGLGYYIQTTQKNMEVVKNPEFANADGFRIKAKLIEKV